MPAFYQNIFKVTNCKLARKMIILFTSPCLILSNRFLFCLTETHKELSFFFASIISHINSNIPINQKQSLCALPFSIWWGHGESSGTVPLCNPTLSSWQHSNKSILESIFENLTCFHTWFTSYSRAHFNNSSCLNILLRDSVSTDFMMHSSTVLNKSSSE